MEEIRLQSRLLRNESLHKYRLQGVKSPLTYYLKIVEIGLYIFKLRDAVYVDPSAYEWFYIENIGQPVR